MKDLYKYGTYSLNLFCYNCGETNFYQIPRGQAYESVGCVNCGCSTLKKADK